MAESIRVLLVDDSPVALAVLRRMLARSPDIEVVGTARNGKEALDLIPELRPSVICTDYHMPVMDGLELTRQVMANFPRPILAISSVVGGEDPDKAFALLEAGAVDVFPKPRSGPEADVAAAQLISKVKLVAGVFVFRRQPKVGSKPGPCERLERSDKLMLGRTAGGQVRIIAMGASTGGPQTLQAILTQMPARFPVPIVCVQHISPGFLQGLIEWLGAQCRVKVQLARPGELLQAGRVYFPAEDTHLAVDRHGQAETLTDPAVDGHRPSVTVLFQSVARSHGAAAAAVLLTGMGRDGADGMVAVTRAGGLTIAQDEASSVIFGMPKHAIDLGAARHVLSPPDIVRALLEAVKTESKGI